MTDQKIYIIDDFYKDPDIVRNFALSLEYQNLYTPNYPGYESRLPCLSSSVIDKFSAIVGSPIDLEVSRKTMGYFRYILSTGSSRLKVHTDMLDWTVVIYLAPECPREIGTQFYKHKATGLYGPPASSQYEQFGFKSFADYENKIVVPDTLKEDAWDVVDAVDYVYNRCLIFKANELFHSHAKGYGDHIGNARMTQNFFFNVGQKNV